MSLNVEDAIKHFKAERSAPYGVDTAIKALRPKAIFSIFVGKDGNYSFENWYEPEGLPIPTKEEIDKELELQKKVAEYFQYVYDRCSEYPTGFDQLDMLWHAVKEKKNFKDSNWFQKIKEIKEKYPKPDYEIPKRN